MKIRNIIGWITILALFGCGQADVDEPADGRDDSFLLGAGKGETGGLIEGSVDAMAIIELANTADAVKLVDEVGLDETTADNIVDGRQENGPFTSLAELDEVDNVGPVAFWALLTYVENNNLAGAGGIDIVGEGDPLVVGKYRYVLHDKLLLKEHEVATFDGSSTFVLWQLHVKADYLAWDIKDGKLIAFGESNLYVINPLGYIEKVFDAGHGDIPNLKVELLTGATTCTIYKNLASYYQGKALGAYMVGNVIVGNYYSWWRSYFEGLYNFSFC